MGASLGRSLCGTRTTNRRTRFGGEQRLALRVRAMTGRRFVSADATTLDVWDLDGDTDAPSRTFKKGGVRDVCHVGTSL